MPLGTRYRLPCLPELQTCCIELLIVPPNRFASTVRRSSLARTGNNAAFEGARPCQNQSTANRLSRRRHRARRNGSSAGARTTFELEVQDAVRAKGPRSTPTLGPNEKTTNPFPNLAISLTVVA